MIATAASLKRLKSHPTADDIHLVDYWETGAMTTWMVNHYVNEDGRSPALFFGTIMVRYGDKWTTAGQFEDLITAAFYRT